MTERGWRHATIGAQNVSALDYLTAPLAHRTVDGPQLFMPLTLRVSNDTKLWGHRSAFATLPDGLRHLRNAERPTTQHPPNLRGMAGDRWLAWEWTNFDDYARLKHVRCTPSEVCDPTVLRSHVHSARTPALTPCRP